MQFTILGLCFSDTAGPVLDHDPYLVALSYLVAVTGSFVALELLDRWRSAKGLSAHYWALAGAVALGSSIWSMHFIGLLAVRGPFPLTFAPAITAASLVIAIAFVGVGLCIIRTGTSWFRIGSAGVVIGCGVAAMHYVGMSGVRFPGTLAYTLGLWGLSLLVSMAAAAAALRLAVTLRGRWHRMLGAVGMAVAICGIHYTGMAAAVFQFDPLISQSAIAPSLPLAAGVTLIILGLLLSALILVRIDRRVWASEKREAEALRLSVAELAAANAALELGRRQFSAVFDNMAQGVCFFDGEQRLLLWNRRYVEIYELPPEVAYVGCSLTEILSFRKAAGTAPKQEFALYVAAGAKLALADKPTNTVYPLENGRIIAITYQPMQDGGWIATHEDVTERQQAEAELVFMARHDALTRLPNRIMFNERLRQAIAAAERGTECAVLYLDLDNFKLVNDTLGHPVGDGLLQAAAKRLEACVRDGDTVARLGGDEFAIIQMAVRQPDDAEALGRRIIAAFHEAFDIDGHQIMVGASIGVTVVPGDGSAAETLLKNADIALYLAKTEGRGTVRFFEPEMDARIHLRRALEVDLRDAIDSDQFEIYYQPLINLAESRITRFEALLRWLHPIRGLVPPSEFIPVAEETGMIGPIGEWVLRTACREATNWPTDIGVAVNLSPVQFLKGDLVATVQAALSQSGLQPNRLELEITETVLLQDTHGALTALHLLRDMGIAVALDDFGTGYSSLSFLRSFPFNKIKIDQSFVRGMMNSRESIAIVRAVVNLGRSLDMTTTAEGVETWEQVDRLMHERCSEVQGYVFSRPCRANDLPALMHRLAPDRLRLAARGAMAELSRNDPR